MYPKSQFLQVSVTANIAWNRQMTYDKVYLPEFMDEPLEEMLRCFRDFGFVEFRRIYNDPRKTHKPLFILTFISQAPNRILLGYIPRGVTTFYPTPER